MLADSGVQRGAPPHPGRSVERRGPAQAPIHSAADRNLNQQNVSKQNYNDQPRNGATDRPEGPRGTDARMDRSRTGLVASQETKDNVTDGNEKVGRENMVCLECGCLLYTSPSPRDRQKSRMPSSA